MSNTADILRVIVAEAEEERPVALCTIVSTRGSTPQPPGTLLAVLESTEIVGTLGGGCAEGEVRRCAHALLSHGGSKLQSFHLDHESAEESGMICGGTMDVAITVVSNPSQARPIRDAIRKLDDGSRAVVPLRVHGDSGDVAYGLHLEPSPKLVIAGAGHIARILAGMAVPIGFRVSVIDDRSVYANATRFPAPIVPVVGDIAGTLAGWPIDGNTYVVLVTRGHLHDQQALAAVLDSPARYIGMVGSRRKVATIFDELRQRGASAGSLERVRAPIGIDIGAVTTAEIALCIAAELVAVHREDGHRLVEGPFPGVENAE